MKSLIYLSICFLLGITLSIPANAQIIYFKGPDRKIRNVTWTFSHPHPRIQPRFGYHRYPATKVYRSCGRRTYNFSGSPRGYYSRRNLYRSYPVARTRYYKTRAYHTHRSPLIFQRHYSISRQHKIHRSAPPCQNVYSRQYRRH
jgi:hypothetical protein